MKSLATFVIRLFELAEAEGRTAQRAIYRLAVALLLLIVSAAVILSAIGLFTAAFFLLLTQVMPVPAVLACLGGGLLLLGIVLAIIAGCLRRKGGRP